MSDALFGIEMETAIVGRGAPLSRTLDLDRAAWALFLAHNENLGTYGFLPNGGRLYRDVGSHPEYATPECTSLRQLVAALRAGERILAALTLQPAVQRARADFGQPQIGLLANNRDSNGVVWGCHENYLVARQQPNSPDDIYDGSDDVTYVRMERDLLAFFVSRQIYSGAGCIDTTEPAPQFRLSQRFDAFHEEVGKGTGTNRALFNTRDEAHADRRFRRLHVIVGDNNRSEWATFLKVGTTQLVLDMIAADIDFSDAALQRPIDAIREYSQLNFLQTSPGSDGRERSALDVQRVYLEAAERHFASHRSSLSDTETSQVLAMWRHAIDALGSGDMKVITAQLGDKVDWVIKWRLLSEHMDKHQVGLDDARVKMLDIAYGDLADGGAGAIPALNMLGIDVEGATSLTDQSSLFSTLRSRGRVATIVSDAEVEALVEGPPPTSRAALRGQWIARVRAAGWTPWGSLGVTEWGWLRAQAETKAAHGTAVAIPCLDPFAIDSPMAAAELARIEAQRVPQRRGTQAGSAGLN